MPSSMADIRDARLPGPWLLVIYLSLTFVIAYMDRQMVFAIFPLLKSDLGFTDAQLGLAGSVFTWTYSLSMPFSGRLADIYPRDRLIVGSIIVWSLATLGTGTSSNVSEFLIWRFVMGISEALYVPAAMRLITQSHTERTRAKALSVHGFGQFTGITLGSWFGGWAGQSYGWRSVFLAMAVVGVVFGMILARGIWGFDKPGAVQKKADASPREILNSSSYIALVTTYFSFCAMLWMLYAWLPNFIYERYHLTLSASALTGTLYLQVSSAIGSLAGGAVGDHFGSRSVIGRFRVAIAGLLCCGPFAVGIFMADSLTVLKLCACGFGLCAGFFISNAFAAAYETVPKSTFGLATGVMNMIGGLGSGAAIFLAGLWKESVGIPTMMLFTVVVLGVLSLILLTVAERKLGTSVRLLETPV